MLELVRGDITAQEVAAIVNAANSSLLGGGGVDGVFFCLGGLAILGECRDMRASRVGRGLPDGQAVATTAGNLPARWVIHTVGPVYREGTDRSSTLRDCYTNSLRVAVELGATSVAFPLISSGIFGWPLDDAAHQAITAIRGHLEATGQTPVGLVRLVLFDERAYRAAEAQL